jgi:hypothetical protein
MPEETTSEEATSEKATSAGLAFDPEVDDPGGWGVFFLCQRSGSK